MTASILVTAAVPLLSPTGLMILAVLLTGAAWIALRRRARIAH
jgi:hypothetical protein